MVSAVPSSKTDPICTSGFSYAEPVLLELQISVDGRDSDQGVVVAVDVVQEAWSGELLGAEPAALLRPLLEDGDVQATLCEVGAEGQAVVAGSDDHRIVGRIRHGRLLTVETPFGRVLSRAILEHLACL